MLLAWKSYRWIAQYNLSSHDWFSFCICRQREALLLKTVSYFVRECTTRQLQSWVITQAHRRAEKERAYIWSMPSAISLAFHWPRRSFSSPSLPLPSSSHPLQQNVPWEYWGHRNSPPPTQTSSAAEEHHVELCRFHTTELWYCRLLCVCRSQIHLSLLIIRLSPSNIPNVKLSEN